jgi:hypothetical protein
MFYDRANENKGKTDGQFLRMKSGLKCAVQDGGLHYSRGPRPPHEDQFILLSVVCQMAEKKPVSH